MHTAGCNRRYEKAVLAGDGLRISRCKRCICFQPIAVREGVADSVRMDVDRANSAGPRMASPALREEESEQEAHSGC